MRGALALYALRFGGWLLAKTSGSRVYMAVHVYDLNDRLGDHPAVSISRQYVP